MKLQYKIWLGMGVAFVLLVGAVELASYGTIKRMVEAELLDDAHNFQAMLMATRRVYHRQFMQSGMPIDARTVGFLPAHALSRISGEIHNWTNTGISFNNVTDRPRNPDNLADSHELAAMHWFRLHAEANEHLTTYIDAHGQEIYHYTAPIRVEPYCLKCHGGPADAPAYVRERYPTAYGYREGELRGVLSIKLPSRDLVGRVVKYWWRDMLLHVAVLLGAFLGGGILLNSLVLRRIKALRGVTESFSLHEQSVPADTAGGDEIADLGRAFNDMAAAVLIQHKSLLDSEEQKRMLLDSSAQCIYGVDSQGRCTFVNPAFLRLMGYGSAEEVIGRNLHALIHHHHSDGSVHPAEECSIRLANQANQPLHMDDDVFWRKDGSPVPVEFWSHPIHRDGSLVGAVVSFVDIGERRQDQIRLRQAAAVYENTLEGVIITDHESSIVAVNRAFSDITGYSEADVLGRNPRILKSGRHDADFWQEFWRSVFETGGWEGEIWNRRKNGETIPEWLSISTVRDRHGKVINYVAVFSDISRIKQTEARLEELAHYDPLTGLPNRLLFQSRLDHALDAARRHHSRLALMFMDLDRFKNINDSLGHPTGDELLSAIARRFMTRLREEDTLARLGGDEFVILLEHLSEPQEALLVAQDIQRLMTEPFTLGNGNVVYITTSIGISLYPEDGEDATHLVKNADAAMYQAKYAGRNTVRFYTEHLSRSANDRLLLETNLRRAIDNDELVLHYQPQVNVGDGRVIGVEALVRWQHPENGLIAPDRFIPVAEECGLIVPLGEWVLRTACVQARQWIEDGLPKLSMAVNLSTRQFRQRDLAERIRATLDATGLDPAQLELEITESVMMEEGNHAREILLQLKSLGIHLAMDDFGTGYSSLANLKHFAIDRLKIDRGFIRDLPDDSNDKELTATIVAMGRNLKLQVLAEGVETERQLSFLRFHGCHAYQGYLFSRPLDAAAASVLLRAHFGLPGAGTD